MSSVNIKSSVARERLLAISSVMNEEREEAMMMVIGKKLCVKGSEKKNMSSPHYSRVTTRLSSLPFGYFWCVLYCMQTHAKHASHI